jgi:hypothetical protein
MAFFNLIVFSMAADAPGVSSASSVALDLGVMADLGKLYLSACDVVSERWRVSMYVDAHPAHRVVRLTKRDGRALMESRRLEDVYELARDRLGDFVRASYLPDATNALVVGGHGSASRYAPVGLLSDGSQDSLTVADIASDVARVLDGRARMEFVALDSCCLSTLENVLVLGPVAKYVLAFQDEAPWNGFVSARTLEICCDMALSWRRRLELVLESYASDALSQERPSGASLLATEWAPELWQYLAASGVLVPLPIEGRHGHRSARTRAAAAVEAEAEEEQDLGSLIERRLEGPERARARQLMREVLLAHRVPRNGAREPPRSGLSVRLSRAAPPS